MISTHLAFAQIRAYHDQEYGMFVVPRDDGSPTSTRQLDQIFMVIGMERPVEQRLDFIAYLLSGVLRAVERGYVYPSRSRVTWKCRRSSASPCTQGDQQHRPRGYFTAQLSGEYLDHLARRAAVLRADRSLTGGYSEEIRRRLTNSTQHNNLPEYAVPQRRRVRSAIVRTALFFI